MNPDGSIGPMEERLFYYRVPRAFLLMDELSAASRMLDWIRGHMFSPGGSVALFEFFKKGWCAWPMSGMNGLY